MKGIVIVVVILFVQFVFKPYEGISQTADFQKKDTTQNEAEKTYLSRRTAIDAIENASLGGSAGVLIGQQMDQQAAELKRALKGGAPERIAEGILITFQSQDLFAPDSYELLAAAKSRIKNFARMMNKFQHSCLLIEVHTDNTGEKIYNQSLSDKRAKNLENYFLREGINNNRVLSKGYGSKQPLSENATEEGRNTNRRVELVVIANAEMKALARKGGSGEFLAVK